MECKRWKTEEVSKNGKREGKQCYICKTCKHQFTSEEGRHSKQEENIAILLYCTGLSFRAIGRILKYNASTIMRWVKKYADTNCKKPIPKGEIVIELDEMWHFIHSKKQSAGYGRLITELQNNL